MKKNNVRNVLLLLLIAATGTFSCKKESVPVQSVPDTEMSSEHKALLERSQKWYISNLVNAKKMSSLSAGSVTTDPVIGTPNWDKVTFFKFLPNVPEFVRVPLDNYPVNCSFIANMSPLGFRDLLLREESTNKFITDVIEIHPDAAYLADKRQIEGNAQKDLRSLVDNSDFTGYFLVYSGKNDLRYGERRVNGVAVSRLSK